MSTLRFALALVLATALPGCGSEVDGVAPTRPGGPGDRCEDGIPVALDPSAVPASFKGDTATQRDDYNLVACVDRLGDAVPGQGSADTVFRLSTATSALYRLTLQGTWPAPTALALTRDCAAFATGTRLSCVASSRFEQRVVAPSIDVFLEAGQDYFLLVDGLVAAGRPDEGAFTVDVGCGCDVGETCTPAGVCRAAQPGDSCADPIVMQLSDPMTSPFSLEGSTVAQPDTHQTPAACSTDGRAHGALAPDRFHQLSAPSDGRYTVTLESLDEGVALGLSAYAGCTAEPSSAQCMASARTTAAEPSTSIELDLHAGDLATLVVDGVDGGAGLYRLLVAPPCVPACATCGISDGCGRTCGCSEGEHCAGGLCVVAPDIAGNTCDTPHEVDGDALPLTLTGDLGPSSGLTDALNALGCPAVQGTGASVRDEVYRLVAPEAGSYTFRVSPRAPGVDPLLYGFVNTCQAASCVAWTDAVAAPRADAESLTLSAAAGDELFVVVDAWRPEAAGAYELIAEKTCSPRCDAGCGTSDGCGGTCGCATGDRCDAGTCTPAAAIPGNTCQRPHELLGSGFPFSASGDIGPASGMTAAVSAAACDAFVTGGSAPDAVWRFAAPSDDVYEVTVTPQASGVDLMLYAFDEESCTTGCVAFADEGHADATDGVERIELTTTAAQVFYLVVDAWGPTYGGPFTLSVDTVCASQCGSTCGGPDGCGGTCGCGDGECQAGFCVAAEDLPGNTCSVPFELGLPPLTVAGDLSRTAAKPSYAATGCLGAGDAGASGNDEVWRFVAPGAGAWDVTVAPDAPLDLMVYAFGDACDATACVGFGDRHSRSLSAETLRLDATHAGQAFQIVVDGWNATAVGTYRLSIASACAPACSNAACGTNDGCGGRCGCGAGDLCRDGVCLDAASVAGDNCDHPRLLAGALPLIGEGDLGGFMALNDDLDAGSCATAGGTGLGAPDEVWSFVAPAVGSYVVSVTPDAGDPLGDLVVYAFSGESCDTCAAHADHVGPDGEERLLLTATYAGQAFRLVVDAWLASTTDRYRITVDRPCTPSCQAGSCADDGCGHACPCASDEVCGAGASCVDARPGDTCAVARALGTGPTPWFGSGDLGPGGGLTNTTSPVDCGGVASDGVDQIWSVVVPSSGRYELVATPDGSADLVLYVFSGSCSGACIALSDEAGPGTEERLSLSGLTSERLWVAVDAANAQRGGRYSLSFDTVCAPQCGATCGGPDGCGGSCGCSGGAICLADETCAPATSIPGNTCQAPLPLLASAGAWVGQGDVDRAALLSDTLDASACGVAGAGRGVNDQIWTFTAPTAGDWEAVVTPSGSADLMLYAFDDTLCTSCLGHVDRDYLGGRAETLLLPDLRAGQTVRVVVDAFAPDAGGAYTLRVAKHCAPVCGSGCGQGDGCGGVCACDGGDLCDAATFACVLPEASLGNTCVAPRPIAVGETRGGDLAAPAFLGDELRATGCPGVGAFDGAGLDQVWWFAAPTTGAYRLEVTAAPASDPMLYAFSADTCAASSCLGFADAGGDGANEVLLLQLTSGEVVRVVVDSWTAPSGGAYTLSVEGL